MPKEKVEINPRKATKQPSSNGSVQQKVQKPKISSSRSKIDEIKKPSSTRENSVDRGITDKNKIRKATVDTKTKTDSILNSKSNKTITSLNKSKSSISNVDTPPSTSIRKKAISTSTLSSTRSKTQSQVPNTKSNGTKTQSSMVKTQSSTGKTSSPQIKTSSSMAKTSSSTTLSSSRDVTSKRVTKEQFFPKKYPFSSYLHENKASDETKRTIDNKMRKTDTTINETPKLTRERTMTRTLSPSEVKVIKNVVTSPTTTLERPRTATIKKAPEIQIDQETESNEYEDDFESYESDFEAYSSSSSVLSIETDGQISETSSSDVGDSKHLAEFNQKRTNSAGTDDERKLDSGNYELHDIKHKQILDNIKEAIEKENSNLNTSINKTETSLASLSDEGFEDGSKHLLNQGFVNFADAKKKQMKKKLNDKVRKRGDDLMNMIRLNSVYFSLFDMDAVSYEDFMQSYGKSGTIQISSQTGDDDLNEEIQTEIIETAEKYTQYPIRFSKEDDKYFGETLNKLEVNTNAKILQKLNKFMEKAGKLMLHILEQKETKTQIGLKQNYSEIPFSDGYLTINFEKAQFLRNRNVVFMTYNKRGQLLTVHEGGIQIFMNETEQLLSRPTICIWDIFELVYPQNILVSSGDITRACFDSLYGNFIFGGICDGSICLWDLREPSNVHREIYDEQSDENHLMRTPTYTTIPKIDLETSCEKIISVKSFHVRKENQDTQFANTQNGIQICTCSETGNIIIWSLIEKHPTPELLSEDQGLTVWGSVILVQGLVIQLQKLNPNLKELQCFDLTLNENETNHLFVASNQGVLHCLVSGMKPKPKLYSSTENSIINCIEMCPFSSTYFLTGSNNGNIKLHSRIYEKPLMILRTLEENTKIELIQWSNCRPCLLFVKDDKNHLNIWDLMSSDMFPIYTIPFNENITDIKLSPILKQDDPVYMAIANKEYGIRLHKMKKQFSRLTPEQYKTELNTFLNYANRL